MTFTVTVTVLPELTPPQETDLYTPGSVASNGGGVVQVLQPFKISVVIKISPNIASFLIDITLLFHRGKIILLIYKSLVIH